MSSDLKYPKNGAVARLRDLYTQITKRPLTPDQRERLLDVFKKKERPPGSVDRCRARLDDRKALGIS